MEIKKKIDYLKANKLSIACRILACLACFVVSFALSNVKIFGLHSTLAFSYLVALLWSGKNPLIVGIFGGCGYLLSNLSEKGAIITSVVVGICIVLFIISRFRHFEYRVVIPYILLTFMLVPVVIYGLGDIKQNATLALAVIFAYLTYYVCKYFFKGTIKRGFSSRLNIDEKVCGGIILTLIAYGLDNVMILDIEVVRAVAVAIILISTYTMGMLETMLISFIFGLGVALHQINPIFVSFYICYAIISFAFKTKFKVFSSLGVIIVELFFSLYFTNYIIFRFNTLIAVCSISLLFIFLPNKVLNNFKDVFAGIKDKVAIRNLVRTNKNKIIKKLKEISKVFQEMQYTFRRTLQHTLPISDKVDMMKQDIVDSVCRDCPDRLKCLRINGEYTTKVFDDMISVGVARGKIGEADINNYLLARCSKLPYLIMATNEILSNYREYNMLVNNMDCSKILVAEQFDGVSQVIDRLAEEVDKDISYDVNLETRIAEDLLYQDVFVEEVIVYEQGLLEQNIVLLVKNDRIDQRAIEKVVSKACHNSIKIVSVEPSELPGVSTVTMRSCPPYDVAFGSATCNKTGTIVSGDTHCFIKIDNGKYMLALSDGMGSGTRARETSDLAINLIENYYKAGFDNDIILSSVNKLLSLNNEETFSAIDLCVLDFFRGYMDFIKLGTPKSFVKHKSGVDVVESSGLPIGILEDIRPHVTKRVVNNFDMIILVSDGVADAFGEENLQTFINNLNAINPQEVAESIITRAKLYSNNVAHDDMTAVVARIFPVR